MSGWPSLPGMALWGCQKCDVVSTLPFPHKHFQSKNTLSAQALLLSPWSQPGSCYTVSPCAWSTMTATWNPAPRRPKHTITTQPSHSTPNFIPEVAESTKVHSSITHNSRKVGMTWLPTSRWTGSQYMIYPCHGTSFHCKKEWSADPCYNMDETQKVMLSKRSQTQEDKYWMILLKIVKFTERKIKTEVSMGWGGVVGELSLESHRELW